MNEMKKIKAARKGLANLQQKIAILRTQLDPLQKAHTKLCIYKWALEESLIEVRYIFSNTKKEQEVNISKIMENLSVEQILEMSRILEEKIATK